VGGLSAHAECDSHLLPGGTIDVTGGHDLDSGQSVGSFREPKSGRRGIQVGLALY
jgi:hypothetical protein